MTSDLDANTDDVYETIRDLWLEAQARATDELAPPSGYGQSVVSVQDSDIAAACGLELQAVREFLDHADGAKVVVGRDGDSRTVKALL